ncbi:unnamed protein product [Cylindrotheca closterium]|uniref:Reverse transcriptase Ty1/copia-type domain-containing protein n=1 Tax=Cylindrotheca closterium TaxID=2856 RepID=A0AAD2FJP3_9STRA|nr:unnamed protein product [Cylindrotheca closterium]
MQSSRERELKPLKNNLKSGICAKEGSRSTKDSKAILEAQHSLCFQQIGNEMKADYEEHDAILIACCMMQIKAKFDTDEGLNFIQQYYTNQGLKKFGHDGKDAVDKELRQLLLRNCFTPQFVKDTTASEQKKAQSAMMLLTEKQFEKTIKGCLVYQGDGTREWLSQEDTASPTALQEAITTTCVIAAHKENGKRVIYERVLRAIYGMLQLSLLFYNQFQSDLEAKGFVFNPYDLCVANKVVDEKQQTIRFHVDDFMSSHMDPKVNDKFAEWLNMRYGSIKACTIVRGKIHRYLGMTLDFSVKGKLKIRMDDYVKSILEDFLIKFNKESKQETPAGNDLLEAGKGKLLSAEYHQIFHTTVARGLYVSKRASLDVHPTITILDLRV